MARLPTTAELRRAYQTLQHRPQDVTARAIALWMVWSRLDARLFEILVGFLSKHFDLINPIELRKELRAQRGEALGCVFCDWVTVDSIDFRAWALAVQNEVEAVPTQSYFIGLNPLRPEDQLRELATSLKPFYRWGFYSSEDPRGSKKQTEEYRTWMGPQARKQILKELLKRQKSITVSDYLEALGGSVHRRQAERDLKSYPKLKIKGNTRSRRYRL